MFSSYQELTHVNNCYSLYHQENHKLFSPVIMPVFSHDIKLEEVLESHTDIQTVLETLLCRFTLGGVIVALRNCPSYHKKVTIAVVRLEKKQLFLCLLGELPLKRTFHYSFNKYTL